MIAYEGASRFQIAGCVHERNDALDRRYQRWDVFQCREPDVHSYIMRKRSRISR